jgi:hypothetical protein
MGKFRNVWVGEGKGAQVQCLDCGQILDLLSFLGHLCPGPPDATVRCVGCGAGYTGKPSQVIVWTETHHCGDPADGLEPADTEGG